MPYKAKPGESVCSKSKKTNKVGRGWLQPQKPHLSSQLASVKMGMTNNMQHNFSHRVCSHSSREAVSRRGAWVGSNKPVLTLSGQVPPGLV